MVRFLALAFVVTLLYSLQPATATVSNCIVPSGLVDYYPLIDDESNAVPSGTSISSYGGVDYENSFARFGSDSDGEIYNSDTAQYIGSPFTLAVTAKFSGTPPKTGGYDYLLIAASDYGTTFSANGNGWGLLCDGTTGVLKLFIGTGNPTPMYVKVSSSVTCSPLWKTYVVTFSGTQFNVYVNGVGSNPYVPAISQTSPIVSEVPTYFSLGNDGETESNGWQGGIVDMAFYSRVISQSEVLNLTPFSYRTILCGCAAGSAIDYTAVECDDSAQTTPPTHRWEYDQSSSTSTVSDYGDADFGSDGQLHNGAGGYLDAQQPALFYDVESAYSMAFSPNAWVSGSFDSAEAPIGSATWTVTGWFQRTSVLSGQSVLCFEKSTCVGFNPSATSQFGLFVQNNSAVGVYASTSGLASKIYFAAVTFVDGWRNVSVWVHEYGTTSNTWTSASGTFVPDGSALNWLTGAQVQAGGATSGGMIVDDVRFYKYALSYAEIFDLGNQTVGFLTVPTGGFTVGPGTVSSSSATGGGSTTGSSAASGGGGGGSSAPTGGTGGGGGFSSSAAAGSGGNSTSSAPTVAYSVLLALVAGAAAV